MGSIRFFRRVQIAPGVRLNLSKSGPSLSLGVRGAHVTMGRRGVTRTVGLPGTGVFYTSHSGHHTGAHTAPAFTPTAGSSQPAQPAGAGCLLALGVVVALAVLAQFCSALH
jgi:hypothetical protein